jgi:hypothetical protein
MRQIGIAMVITGLLSLGIWGCGGNGDGNGPTGPEAPEVSEADYAVWGMIITAEERSAVAAKEESAESVAMVVVGLQKNDGSESVADWPSLEASEVKLIGPKEITLTKMSFPPLAARSTGLSSKGATFKEIGSGNGEIGMLYYTLPEGETVAPGEAYKLRLTVEGKTFTSKSAAMVLDALSITTPDEQHIELEVPFTVQWQAVQHADGYVVDLTFPDVITDTTFVVGTATQKTLAGELFTEEGEYYINVMAYAGTIAQYIDQWVKEQYFAIYDFDDPKVLGTFSSATGNDITVWVGTGEEPEEPEPGEMEITVSGELTPTISWTGGNAQSLSVSPADHPDIVMWSVIDVTGLGFASPVIYGQPPTGTFQLAAAQPLIAGTTYEVWIVGVNAEAFGTETFTP